MPMTQVAGWLQRAERIAVLSGAGLSKASGISTYRDAGGLWTRNDTARFSSIDALRDDPEGFAAFWSQRRREVAAAQPNPGHRALAELQRLKPGTTLITQNIDGLLTAAGAQHVLELHGNLGRDRCGACGLVTGHGAPAETGGCPSCRAPLQAIRPDVVMFGEFLDSRISAAADRASKLSEVFLLVGTSAVVRPASGMAEKAVMRGARLVVVNLEPTPLDAQADVVIAGRTEDVLPRLVERLKGG
jgi:NAD-dependent deacetylase